MLRYYKGVVKMKNPKFLTLTLQKNVGNLQSRLMNLWEMRKTLFYYLTRGVPYGKNGKKKKYVIRSWCGIIEPPNHVHIVVDCEFIPSDLISKVWHTVTGDSYIVDIREVDRSDLRKVAGYITKYMTKAGQWAGMNLDLLEGFHLIASWGLANDKVRKPVCVCGTLKPLHKLDILDYLSMFHYPGGKKFTIRRWPEVFEVA